MKISTDKRDIHIYFPPEIYEALKELATTNRRSLTAEVVIAVEKHIGDKEAK